MEVFLIAEHKDGQIKRVTVEILGELLKQQVEPTTVLLGTSNLEPLATELGKKGATKIAVLEHADLFDYSTEGYANALHSYLSKTTPTAVITGATSSGKNFLPRLAAKFGAGIATDCTEFTLSGDTVQELNLYKMEDLQLKVPNLQMTESGISTQIYIRGIGSGNNQGFEQSVGMYVDGIYYGRQQLIRQPIFDIQRVEVLRGPQGILFGKNSIAGAVAYTTAQPSGEFSSYLRTEYDWDHNATIFEGTVNGGSDTLAARISVRKFDDDGWVYNVLEERDEPGRDDFAIRGQVRWEPTVNLDMNLKIERQEFKTKGRQIEIIEDMPPSTSGPQLSRVGAYVAGSAPGKR